MSNVCNWLESSHLHLNVLKTVAIYFSKRVNKSDTDPNIFVGEKKLDTVQELKYRDFQTAHKKNCQLNEIELFQL